MSLKPDVALANFAQQTPLAYAKQHKLNQMCNLLDPSVGLLVPSEYLGRVTGNSPNNIDYVTPDPEVEHTVEQSSVKSASLRTLNSGVRGRYRAEQEEYDTSGGDGDDFSTWKGFMASSTKAVFSNVTSAAAVQTAPKTGVNFPVAQPNDCINIPCINIDLARLQKLPDAVDQSSTTATAPTPTTPNATSTTTNAFSPHQTGGGFLKNAVLKEVPGTDSFDTTTKKSYLHDIARFESIEMHQGISYVDLNLGDYFTSLGVLRNGEHRAVFNYNEDNKAPPQNSLQAATLNHPGDNESKAKMPAAAKSAQLSTNASKNVDVISRVFDSFLRLVSSFAQRQSLKRIRKVIERLSPGPVIYFQTSLRYVPRFVRCHDLFTVIRR